MMHKPVTLSVIGCGGYSFQLIKRIMTIPNSGIISAVTSRDPDSEGAAYCREQGIRVFATVEELLAYGEFEAVVNPTPIHLHASISKQILKAGFPVLMEKPPVATVQELDDLSAASKSAGLPIALCFNSLYAHLFQQLKKELVEGRFGAVRRVKGIGAWVRTDEYFTRNSWAGKLRNNDTWILDGDINNPFAHVLCNGLFFAANEHHALAEPLSVEAELYRCNAIESEDTSCIRIITRNGVEVLTWLTLGSETEIEPRTVIETEKAVITIENFQTVTIQFNDGTIETRESYQENRIEMLQQLCHAIRTGNSFICDLEMSRPFTVTVNAAFESTGSICSVADQYLDHVAVGDATQSTIRGIDGYMEKAFDANQLLSETGVPWARKSKIFNAENYTRFPVRFSVGNPKSEGVQLKEA